MSLTAATRSESAKVFTTSMWWLLAIVLFAYVAFTAAVLGGVLAASASGNLPGSDAPQIPEEGLAATLYSTATAIAYVFPLLIGTLMVTGEIRHQTLTPTFLATPRRGRVLIAKLVIGVLLGILYGVLGVVASVAPSAPFLLAMDLDTQLDQTDMWAMFGRMVLAFVLWVCIGIGVGALVRNQVGAVVGVIVFTQFVEPIVRLIATFIDGADEVARYLPGAASDTLVGASLYTAMSAPTPGAADPLEWWVGALVLLGYAVVFLFLGWLSSWRRDVS